MEKWKSINEEYEVSNLGRIRRTKNNRTKYLKPEVLKKGYLRVSVWENGVRKRMLVHRLVAQMFISNKDKTKTQIDHINNNTSDNRVENLRWVSSQRNISLRDENQNKIGALISELIQEYGYQEVYNYLLQKRKPKAK